jgi:allophanate hydrolase subunit 2
MTAHIEVARVAGVATVQDAGRPGRMHEGIPAGGALVPEQLARANEAASNGRDAAVLEIVGSIALTARGASLTLADDDGSVHVVPEGDTVAFDASRTLRVRYVAVRGGLDVPRVLGGRGTLLVASLGGHEGRVLRRGDRIAVGDEPLAPTPPRPLDAIDLDLPIRIRLGPDLARFEAAAAQVLTAHPFALSPSSDRTGSRLVGPRLFRVDADDGRSAPMVHGAIEVTAKGDAIVLGPDHPTTGGYPILAVVVRADLGRFHARPIGVPVRFVALAR